MALWRRRRREQEEGALGRTAPPSDYAWSASDAPTVLRLVDNPRSVATTKLGQDAVLTLLATGIVNPFGPTLNVLAIVGDPQPEQELPVVRALLNPFTQEATEVGFARIGERWDLAAHLRPFFSFIAGSCPTVLMPSTMLDDEEALALCTDFLQIFDDGFELLEKVRRFPGDPWKRVEEVEGIGDILQQAELGEEPADTRRTLTQEEARALAISLLDEENLKQELAAFYAWNSSMSSSPVRWPGRTITRRLREVHQRDRSFLQGADTDD